jgi:hypothetical protein
MKSNKQRRREIKADRQKRTAKLAIRKKKEAVSLYPARVPVNPELLKPDNSYGVPDFLDRGFYLDTPFRCKDCDKEEIWTATQQKWWYEVAKGYVYSTAVRCRPCRRRERIRKQEARETHLQGLKSDE